MWLAAVVVYARMTHARNLMSAIVFWAAVPVLTLIWYHNIAGPPPPDPRTAPIAERLFFSLVVAWGTGMDRTRTRATTRLSSLPDFVLKTRSS